MSAHSADGKGGRSRDKRLLAVVGVGMVLFISGFLLAVVSLSDGSSATAEERMYLASEDEQGQPVSLFLGLLLSLAGVVLATAAPAVFFIHARNGSA